MIERLREFSGGNEYPAWKEQVLEALSRAWSVASSRIWDAGRPR